MYVNHTDRMMSAYDAAALGAYSLALTGSLGAVLPSVHNIALSFFISCKL